ncbi:MAG: efflux RND transporter periplasmic adaptor subunit [Bacteroidia bacterium]
MNFNYKKVSTMKSMKNTFPLTAAVMVALILTACHGGSPDKKAELEKLRSEKSALETRIAKLEDEVAKGDTTHASEKTEEVVAQALKPETFKTYIDVQGRVDADENVSLSSEVPGTVTQINVKVGDEVSKGQVLAETDTRAIAQQVSDLQTSYSLASQVYDKQKTLWDQKIGTEIQYLQAKSAKESLEKKMGSLQEQMRMSKIISPINGTVDGVNIKVGQAIAPGMAAVNVINFSNLKVKADVAENYASRVKSGNEAVVLFPDTKDSVVSKVHFASRGINTLTRTFLVEVMLDNTKEYHPNMVAKLKINDYQSPKPEIVLPVKFIQKSATGNYVMVVENGKAVIKKIETGREYNGKAEVINGLTEGEMLITEGYDQVNEGDKVIVKK